MGGINLAQYSFALRHSIIGMLCSLPDAWVPVFRFWLMCVGERYINLTLYTHFNEYILCVRQLDSIWVQETR